jgi:hypothetical protein
MSRGIFFAGVFASVTACGVAVTHFGLFGAETCEEARSQVLASYKTLDAAAERVTNMTTEQILAEAQRAGSYSDIPDLAALDQTIAMVDQARKACHGLTTAQEDDYQGLIERRQMGRLYVLGMRGEIDSATEAAERRGDLNPH